MDRKPTVGDDIMAVLRESGEWLNVRQVRQLAMERRNPGQSDPPGDLLSPTVSTTRQALKELHMRGRVERRRTRRVYVYRSAERERPYPPLAHVRVGQRPSGI